MIARRSQKGVQISLSAETMTAMFKCNKYKIPQLKMLFSQIEEQILKKKV
jgi:hypothetical protein